MKQSMDVVKRHRVLLLFFLAHYGLLLALWVESQWKPLGLDQEWIAAGTLYILGVVFATVGYFVGGLVGKRRKNSDANAGTVTTKIDLQDSAGIRSVYRTVETAYSAPIKPESGMTFMTIQGVAGLGREAES